MPTDKGNPTKEERDERVTVPEGVDPLDFLAGLMEVDPEAIPAAHADPSYDMPGDNVLAAEDDDD